MIGNHYLGAGQIAALRPRVTMTWCHIWKVIRSDLVTHRFVSHDKRVKWRGEVYEPLGPNVSDMEQSEAGSESDFEVIGFLSADTILADEIQSGRYDGCRIEHHVIDWERPWPNAWVRKHVWWIKDIQETGTHFRAKVQGVERFLTIPAGKTYERECEKTLGSPECGATPRSLIAIATVEVVATPLAPILGVYSETMAMTFTSASWSNWLTVGAIRDGLLTQGKVRWVNGPNKGTQQIIAEHLGRQISLETEAPFPIKAGDVADIWSGCPGTRNACQFDYANIVNFGGQPHMPSTEDTYRKPTET